MSEASLYSGGQRIFGKWAHTKLQGYLAKKKTPRPRNLQEGYAYGPMVILGGGRFLMSEVSLYLGFNYVSVYPFSVWQVLDVEDRCASAHSRHRVCGDSRLFLNRRRSSYVLQ